MAINNGPISREYHPRLVFNEIVVPHLSYLPIRLSATDGLERFAAVIETLFIYTIALCVCVFARAARLFYWLKNIKIYSYNFV